MTGATKVHGETLPVPDNALSFTLKEPVGVAALIVPWNYPLMLLAWKLGPALLGAGERRSGRCVAQSADDVLPVEDRAKVRQSGRLR